MKIQVTFVSLTFLLQWEAVAQDQIMKTSESVSRGTWDTLWQIQAGPGGGGGITGPNKEPYVVSIPPTPPPPQHPTGSLLQHFLHLPPLPSPPSPPLPSLTEPLTSSCWPNFLDDVRVHVHGACRWCFWMNECPLPSRLLVLRDVYKSRSPGQPAEFHEAPRCERETRHRRNHSENNNNNNNNNPGYLWGRLRRWDWVGCEVN